VRWKIKAPTGNSVEISKIEVTFPQGSNGNLTEVHLAARRIANGNFTSPATITTFSGGGAPSR
jgi:hypothetical protein